MKGDFTRDTFHPHKHFSRVLMQQGRVTLDADFNEQAAILLRYLRKMARDIIGPYGAPVEDGGFKLEPLTPQQAQQNPNGIFRVSEGFYYVNGLLVENDKEHCTYTNQPNFLPASDSDPLLLALKNKGSEGDQPFWIYLDVWERHITHFEDDSIREKALGGPDTCTRAKVVWQVKALTKKQVIENFMAQLAAIEKQKTPDKQKISDINVLIKRLGAGTQGEGLPCYPAPLPASIGNSWLAARVYQGSITPDACEVSPEAKYRGAENQLYRVEIHDGSNAGKPTFKWSRDNGSVVTDWLGSGDKSVQVASTRGFEVGAWIELADDDNELLGTPGTLAQLIKVEGDNLFVDPNTLDPKTASLAPTDERKHPTVRRWDGVASIEAHPLKDDQWIDLEDGIQVKFCLTHKNDPPLVYRTGDYWLIPARVATGEIEWPIESGPDGKPIIGHDGNFIPIPKIPNGIEHHYAPLGWVWWEAGATTLINSCDCSFAPQSSCSEFAKSEKILPAGDQRALNPKTPSRTARKQSKSSKSPV